MTSPRVVRVGGSPTVTAVRVGGEPTGGPTVVDGPRGATTLDELRDVDGAATGLAGQVLVKGADQVWRPATVSGDGTPTTLSYRHTQDSPSTVWLITHGLPFEPAGVEVFDHLDARHFPTVSYPAAGTVRLDFVTPIRGTARLS